jgi:hypothetical protein
MELVEGTDIVAHVRATAVRQPEDISTLRDIPWAEPLGPERDTLDEESTLLAPRADAVALFLLLRLGPKVVLALPAGALCDRFGALPLLRLVRFAGVAPSLFLLAGAAFGHLTVDLLLISAALTAAVMAFDQPAHRMLLHRYAPGNLLVGGVALNTIAATLAALAGPLVLALAVALPGTLWAFRSRRCSRRVRSDPVGEPRVAGGAGSGRRFSAKRLPEAVRHLVSSPALLALILLVGLPGLLERLLTLATPGYAAPATGARLDDLALPRPGDRRPPGRLARPGWAARREAAAVSLGSSTAPS